MKWLKLGSSYFSFLQSLGALLLVCNIHCASSGRLSKKNLNLSDGFSCQITLLTKTNTTLNLDRRGKPLPTRIKIYQLKKAEILEQTSFADLWPHDEQALKDVLTNSAEFTVYPNNVQKNSFTAPVAKDTGDYLGIVAIFREPKDNQWFGTIPLKELCQIDNLNAQIPHFKGRNPLYITVQNSTLTISKQPFAHKYVYSTKAVETY